jgi:hypothetical protein
VIRGHWRDRLWLPQRRPAIFVNVFSATTGDRSRAIHARSHANNPVRRHILAAKPRALCRQEPATELHRQEPAPRRQTVPNKLGLHRPVVPCTRVGPREPRTRRQVPPNQRPVLRSHNPESNKPAPMRSPLKIPKRLRQEREIYSSPIFLVLCRARHIQREPSKLVRDLQLDPGQSLSNNVFCQQIGSTMNTDERRWRQSSRA